MELLDILKKAGRADEFEKSSNYYFERHICPADGKERKIMMDFVLENEGMKDVIRFGICPECGKVYYHKDINTKLF